MNVLHQRLKQACLLFVSVLLLYSCQKSALDAYYEQPSGVGSSIWESLQKEGRFTQFLKAIEKIGDEKSLQFSLITVMAPPDSVFNKFLSDNGYSSIDDIPIDELKYIIEYHLIDWPHPTGDLRQNPEFFKRRTRTSKPNDIIVDDQGNETEVLNGNKYLQFFYDEFFDFYGGNAKKDYKLLTGKDYKGLHVYDATITKADRRFANGWVHEVDKVLIPPGNMDTWFANHSNYSLSYSMLNRFSDLETSFKSNPPYNPVNLIYQSAAWIVGYWPKYEGIGNWDVRDQPGLLNKSGLTFIAPSNDAMKSFMDTYFSKYAEKYGPDYIDSISRPIMRELMYPVTFKSLLLPGKFEAGKAINNELQVVDVNVNDAEIGLCSNGIVYGTNKYQVPRILKGVTKPLLTDPKYSKFAAALQCVGAIAALRDKDLEFTVLAPTNDVFDKELMDYVEVVGKNNLTRFNVDGVEMPTTDLADIVYSHILYEKIDPTSTTGFYKCYGGWYVAINDTAAWSGGNTTIYPHLGEKIESPEVDNGVVFPVDNFVARNFNTIGAEIYNRPEFSKFKELCEQVNFFDPDTKALKFIIYPYRYTAFIPSNETLEAMETADEIPADLEGLSQFIKYHFVRGDIFPNGEISGTLNTAFLDEENTTDYREVYFTANVINSVGNLSVQGTSNPSPIPIVDGNNSNIICFDGVIQTIDGVLKY